DVDSGDSTNRTVVTFIGTPEAVKEAAFKAIRKASEVIDMSKHTGAHSRMGATDVCPFVPVTGVTMEDCIWLAHDLAKRASKELGIPIYLYEEAAQRAERKNLAIVREGEYEGLEQKFFGLLHSSHSACRFPGGDQGAGPIGCDRRGLRREPERFRQPSSFQVKSSKVGLRIFETGGQFDCLQERPFRAGGIMTFFIKVFSHVIVMNMSPGSVPEGDGQVGEFIPPIGKS
ncbi:MAG: hypothetical protein GY950_00265, partial [bacterium]|nr:hypothetical protein [bacterium]